MAAAPTDPEQGQKDQTHTGVLRVPTAAPGIGSQWIGAGRVTYESGILVPIAGDSLP